MDVLTPRPPTSGLLGGGHVTWGAQVPVVLAALPSGILQSPSCPAITWTFAVPSGHSWFPMLTGRAQGDSQGVSFPHPEGFPGKRAPLCTDGRWCTSGQRW